MFLGKMDASRRIVTRAICAPAWDAAMDLLEDNAHRAVSVAEIYGIWRNPPFGIKEGLLPVLVVAFILSIRSNAVFYRQGIFQSRMTDLDTDYLAKDPASVQLRWMDLSDTSRRLLSGMADIVRSMDTDQTLPELEPIDVARGLVSLYDRLPPWVDRTQLLSANARRLRQLFKQASDPNRLIFDEIPAVLSDGESPSEEKGLTQVTDRVRERLDGTAAGLRHYAPPAERDPADRFGGAQRLGVGVGGTASSS